MSTIIETPAGQLKAGDPIILSNESAGLVVATRPILAHRMVSVSYLFQCAAHEDVEQDVAMLPADLLVEVLT